MVEFDELLVMIAGAYFSGKVHEWVSRFVPFSGDKRLLGALVAVAGKFIGDKLGGDMGRYLGLFLIGAGLGIVGDPPANESEAEAVYRAVGVIA